MGELNCKSIQHLFTWICPFGWPYCSLYKTRITLRVKVVLLLLCLIFWPHFAACGILFPWPGIKPMFSALEVQSLNHWTASEVSKGVLLIIMLRWQLWTWTKWLSAWKSGIRCMAGICPRTRVSPATCGSYNFLIATFKENKKKQMKFISIIQYVLFSSI